MKHNQEYPFEQYAYGKLRSKHTILPEKLSGVVDYPCGFGWHECNDRYAISREALHAFCHTHLLLFTLSGEGQAHTNDRSFRLTPDTVMIFLKDHPHSYRVPTGGLWEFYWLHLDGINCTALLEHIVSEYGNCFEISCMDKIIDLMESLMQTEYRYYQYELFAAKSISEMLFSLIDGVRTPSREINRRKELTLEIIRCIESNYRQPLHLADISARFYLSGEYLIRVFHTETGMTPYQYLRQYRLRRACILLEESEMSVSEIALSVGYGSSSSFIAQFKALYGITPLAYRNIFANRPNPN